MQSCELDKLLTAYDIADIAGMTMQGVYLRLKNQGNKYIRDFKSNGGRGGRHQKLYDKSVLDLFPQARLYQQKEAEEKPKLSTRRNYNGRGKNRYISEALEIKIKNTSYNYYLNQARRDNIELCTRWAVQDYWIDIQNELKSKEKYLEFEKFLWYFYSKRITRKDGYWVGYAHKEKWQQSWDSTHRVNELNGKLPTNSYSYIELFEDVGLIGEGFGAGLIWIADATQFDVWVDKDGKKQTISYLMIIDGITGMPLYLHLLEKGESIQDISKAFAECLNIHGKPAMGVLMDNGAAFRSAELRNYIKSWYMPEEIERFKKWSFRKKLFGGQTEPYLYPLARIPRYPFKAKIERMFDEINRHQSECYPLSYIGTRDSRHLTHEIGSYPTIALLNAPNYQKAFENFLSWVYTEFINRIQNSSLNYFAKKYKQKSTILNAWQFYGGKFELNDFQVDTLNSCKQLHLLSAPTENQNSIPEISRIFELYATCPEEKKHKIQAGLGFVNFAEDNIRYNIQCEKLAEFVGRPVIAILDSNKAYLFKENDPNWYDERTPNPDDIYYIGEGRDHTIRKEDDLEIRHITKQNRKNIQKKINNEIEQIYIPSAQSSADNSLRYDGTIADGYPTGGSIGSIELNGVDDFEEENDDLDKFFNF